MDGCMFPTHLAFLFLFMVASIKQYNFTNKSILWILHFIYLIIFFSVYYSTFILLFVCFSSSNWCCVSLLINFTQSRITHTKRSNFDDKVLYTVFICLIYVFAQLPLAGIEKDIKIFINDPIYFLRGVFGTEPRTLLEFSVFSIVSSGLIM